MSRIVIALIGSLALLSPGQSSSPAAVTPRSHIMFIVLENREYGDITSSSMPFLYAQAQKYVLLTNEYAIRHPSLPNYIGLIAGRTFYLDSNCERGDPGSGWPCNISEKSLTNSLSAKGLGWKGYMENLPAGCSNVETAPGGYAKKHNPFMFFDRIRNNGSRCKARVVPLTQLTTDLANNELPRYSFLTPNLCHDGHDCSLATADDFLAAWVPLILARIGSTGVIFITFDEGATSEGCCNGQAKGGHVFTAIIGPGAKLNTKITKALDHYSLLRAVEENWGMRLLNRSASAPTLRGWQS
jgi:hypothetical protein